MTPYCIPTPTPEQLAKLLGTWFFPFVSGVWLFQFAASLGRETARRLKEKFHPTGKHVHWCEICDRGLLDCDDFEATIVQEGETFWSLLKRWMKKNRTLWKKWERKGGGEQ